MSEVRIRAYGKVNLSLDILGLFDNGYHRLDMVMASVDVADELTLEDIDTADILLECAGGAPPGRNNLAYRAAELFRNRSGVRRGTRISLHKHIPAMAGMGGGSSDAAAVLNGLNALWEVHISADTLREWALELGADVPFCIEGGVCRCRGLGEQLTPIACAVPIWLVIVKPEEGLATPAVYRQYDAMGPGQGVSTQAAVHALQTGDLDAVASAACNVLEPAAMSLCPAVGQAKADLMAQGALTSVMTGSGTAVYGIFREERQARRASQALKRRWKFCMAVRTLDSGMAIQ